MSVGGVGVLTLDGKVVGVSGSEAWSDVQVTKFERGGKFVVGVEASEPSVIEEVVDFG